MRILINCSNLKVGGGVQVADSLCDVLSGFPQHRFVVVLSSWMRATRERLAGTVNVEVYEHDVKNDWRTLFLGRDSFLDQIVDGKQINVVLTVFGPSRWNPRCLHISGFASPYLVLPDSPFYRLRLPFSTRFRLALRNRILFHYYRKSTRLFFTENPYVSERLERLIPGCRVATVTNYYNQIYDRPEMWKHKGLPAFDGVTLLTVTAPYIHKNLPIALGVAQWLRREHPDFRFRFVFTVDKDSLSVPEELRAYFLLIGKVDITECPSLYMQCDIMFQPTLLECFTATYPEAMRMRRPIVTTDIAFAHGLCGDAAVYYDALSASAAGEAVYRVATDAALRCRLVEAGERRLQKFDNYVVRAEKLVGLLETEYEKTQTQK